jgi:hypothetical protein
VGEREFKVGDRVRLSELGKSRSKAPSRKGVVTGMAKSSSQLWVHWDGLKLAQVIHRSYLEADEPG